MKKLFLVVFLLFLTCDAEFTKVSESNIITPQSESINKDITSENHEITQTFNSLLSIDFPECTGSSCAHKLEGGEKNAAMAGGFYMLLLAIILACLRVHHNPIDYFRSILSGFGVIDSPTPDYKTNPDGEYTLQTFFKSTSTSEKGKEKDSLIIATPNDVAKWIRGRDNKFKMNIILVIVSSLLMLAQWLEDTNGSDPTITKIFFCLVLHEVFIFFGGLAATGRLSLDTFRVFFFAVMSIFAVTSVIDVVIVLSLVAFSEDLLTRSNTMITPTTIMILINLIRIVSQQLYGNLMRENWVFREVYFKKPIINIVKSSLILLLAIYAVIHLVKMTDNYHRMSIKNMCQNMWIDNVTTDRCEIFKEDLRSSLSLCKVFCEYQANDEPFCKNLEIAKSDCPKKYEETAVKRNIGKDFGTAIILCLISYLTFGGLIKDNKFAFSGLASQETQTPSHQQKDQQKVQQDHQQKTHQKGKARTNSNNNNSVSKKVQPKDKTKTTGF